MNSSGTRLPDPIRELAGHQTGPGYVVSCYLRLDPEERARRQYLRRLKGAVSQAEHAIAALPAEERRRIGGDLRRIVKAVEVPGRLPRVPGLALFACEPRKLFLSVPLPQVYQTRVVVDHAPQLRELFAAEAELGRLLLAAFDRKVARFFAIDAFDAHELPGLFDPSTRGGRFRTDRRDSPGWGERDFHHRIEEERHRHFEAVCRRLAELDRVHWPTGIILAGPLDATRAAAQLLPPRLAGRFMGEVRLNPTAVRPAQVREAALRIRHAYQNRHEKERVATLEDRIGAGFGTNGPQDTLRALARGQVRTLFLRPELTGADSLVNEAIEEALRQRVEVAVIHDPALAAAIDGLAAEFRFK
jgi:peptide subunit release factor 1 (eRF1)